MIPPNFSEMDLDALDDVIIGADPIPVLMPPKRRRKTNLVKGIGVALLGLGGCGLLLLPVSTRTSGATVSGRVRKIEHRMDGLVLIEDEESPTADVADLLADDEAAPEN